MDEIDVVAAVIKKDGKIFCARRKNEGPTAGKWEFPGGKIETGESKEAALVREIYEELNVIIEVKNFIMTTQHQYPTFHITMHAYYCDIKGGIVSLNEHLDSKWLYPDKLFTLDWAEADLPILKMIK